ncbi:MAG: hypothetical protein QOH51_1648 [Acidobacteriota bacterium]|jgi:hypothetical protein|nr:hypothetical protein [Acidobacteriota bacterium]
MSINSHFDEDAFISYGHIDNQQIEDEQKGWVDKLHEHLAKKLSMRLGYRPQIWRDARLPGNVYFADTLEDRIANTCVLISVISPGYLNSAWCMGELQEFCRLAKKSGGLRTPSGRLRIFKVVKTLIEREQHPPEFQGQLGYEFYEEEEATGYPVEFGQGLGKQFDQRYWTKLDELAWDIKRTLAEIKPPPAPVAPAPLGMQGAQGTPPAPPPAPPPPTVSKPKGTVYLAETTKDLREDRDKIKFELLDRGYEILPNGMMPDTSPEYEEAVRENLRQAKLSIHLIGAKYGMVPEGAGGNSVVRLQNEIAAERSGEAGFARLIWLPEQLQPSEETQAQFIDYLKTSAKPQLGAELLQTTLEELKAVIQVKLNGNGHRPAQEAAASTERKIYLICDGRDVEGVTPINDFLFDRGYEVILPPLDAEADDSQAIEKHKKNLVRCDAVLIYYGSANQSWFDIKWGDIEKAVAAERTVPLLARCVYVTGTPTGHKTLYKTREAVLVKNFKEFTPESLEPFLARVESAAKGVDNA